MRTGGTKRDDLRMRGRIGILFPSIASLADDPLIVVDNGSNWNFTTLGRFRRQRDGSLHHLHVPWSGGRHASSGPARREAGTNWRRMMPNS